MNDQTTPTIAQGAEVPAGTTKTLELQAEAKGRVGSLAMVWPYLKTYRKRVAMAVVALTAAAAATLAVPMAVRRMIDFGFDPENNTLIDQYFAMLVVLVGFLAAASAARFYFVSWLGERVVSDIRRDVFAHVMRLHAAFFDGAKSGEIISRLTADTTQIKSVVGSSISIALRNLFLFIGAVVMMVITSPKLSLLVLAAIPLVVLPMVAFGRNVRKRSRAAQDTLADATAYASEAIGAVRTLQNFTAEKSASARFAGAVDEAFDAARAAVGARAALTAFAIFTVFASVVAVLWYGSLDMLAGNISPGSLSQFVLYSVFAAGSLGALSQVWGEVAQAAGAAERLGELLAIDRVIAAPANPATLDKITGAVSFQDVSFSYPGVPNAPILHNVTIDIAPGETVALVGPSGAGKSTLFSLLTRAYDTTGGAVLLDGTEIRRLEPEELRKHLSIVPQETVIFGASIAENIGLGNPQAGRDDIEAAAKAARADEFIIKMAGGYDSVVGERGITLSGGQRQRIAIARAILKDAPVLLLDEATSSLDAESETLVQHALEQLMEGRTTLVIAHRLATILKADRILVMEAGRIVESGTHQSLQKQGGLYARLADLQFQVRTAAE
ncbi:ABC transporter transmembrane domain-containing protein [Pararhizobium sp. IMCC21322]|uniref:ABC transporter transmembrane domain-containing protein n=1 Tax=Pararhizobium sp. IMCC21322 TaxID=3067903 RepID=UPI0027408C9B|nr:ABC transporter transmembrane domain-containing protein [Pararhizobium sp. IMCC21322]